MSKKDVIFFSIVFLWLICIIGEVLIFPTIAKEYGILLNMIPLSILFFSIFPGLFSNKYGNWLESDFTIDPLPDTIKELRLKKLKKLTRYRRFRFSK